MSNHLPECPQSDGLDWCCCNRLRACEQRVSEETEHAMMEFFHWKPSPPHDKHYFADNICAYCVGRREGLDAVREAVPHDEGCLTNAPDADYRDCNCWRPQALAAIDALREGKK